MNIPFADKGRSVTGSDCWGLVRLIYMQELGIALQDYSELYDTTLDKVAIPKLVQDERQANWSSPLPGDHTEFDIIIMRMRGLPMHVGVVTKPFHMVHCSSGTNTTHEDFRRSRRQHAVMGFARWIA